MVVRLVSCNGKAFPALLVLLELSPVLHAAARSTWLLGSAPSPDISDAISANVGHTASTDIRSCNYSTKLANKRETKREKERKRGEVCQLIGMC